jgi:hypothetical protein
MSVVLAPVTLSRREDVEFSTPEGDEYVSQNMLHHYIASCKLNRRKVKKRQNISTDLDPPSNICGVLVTSMAKKTVFDRSLGDEVYIRRRSASEPMKLPKLDRVSIIEEQPAPDISEQNSNFGKVHLPPIKRVRRNEKKVHFLKLDPRVTEEEKFIKEFNLISARKEIQNRRNRNVTRLEEIGNFRKETPRKRAYKMYLEERVDT